MLAELAKQREAEVLEIADPERRRAVVAATTAQLDARQESVRRSLLDLERNLVQAARSSDEDEAATYGGVSDTGNSVRTASRESTDEPDQRVFLHYSALEPGAEALADRVALDLAGRGVPVADIRAVGFGIGVSRTRYFFGNEATAAPAIGAMVAGSLGADGGSAPEVQDFTHIEPKPSPGTIEVWVRSSRDFGRAGS